MAALPAVDELEMLGALRGAPVPIVKCVTNDIYVPADAEYVLEGYLDPEGHVEPEGPFGEYVGYYGVVKSNPVFHLTAITHRKDALFQTVTIGGNAARPHRHRAAHHGEDGIRRVGRPRHRGARAGRVFRHAVERRHVQCPRLDPAARAGRGANAIAAVFGSMAEAKQVFVFDDDIDVFSDEQCDWALATRYQGDRDTIRLGLPRGAARSVARRRAHRRQDRLRLHHPVRQANRWSRCRRRR